MQIIAQWITRSDGVTRPMVQANVLGASGNYFNEFFLIDTGADRTVLSASFAGRLNLPASPPPPGYSLVGISGQTGVVLLSTVLEFTRDDGGPARVHGELAAFTAPGATDSSVLGRDVLDHFDLIVSRRRNEVLLLAPRHQYQGTRV